MNVPEDLRLAEHHRVQAASDAEDMPNGLGFLQQEQAVTKAFVELLAGR